MSTRSLIVIQPSESDLSRYIYCHSDGDLRGVGQVLLTHYSNSDKVNDLIDLGDISSLESEPDNCERPENDFAYARGVPDVGEEGSDYVYVFRKTPDTGDQWQWWVKSRKLPNLVPLTALLIQNSR